MESKISSIWTDISLNSVIVSNNVFIVLSIANWYSMTIYYTVSIPTLVDTSERTPSFSECYVSDSQQESCVTHCKSLSLSRFQKRLIASQIHRLTELSIRLVTWLSLSFNERFQSEKCNQNEWRMRQKLRTVLFQTKQNSTQIFK